MVNIPQNILHLIEGTSVGWHQTGGGCDYLGINHVLGQVLILWTDGKGEYDMFDEKDDESSLCEIVLNMDGIEAYWSDRGRRWIAHDSALDLPAPTWAHKTLFKGPLGEGIKFLDRWEMKQSECLHYLSNIYGEYLPWPEGVEKVDADELLFALYHLFDRGKPSQFIKDDVSIQDLWKLNASLIRFRERWEAVEQGKQRGV